MSCASACVAQSALMLTMFTLSCVCFRRRSKPGFIVKFQKMCKIFFVNWRYWKVGNVSGWGQQQRVMKHKLSINFPNHKNLMDMLVQTYDTFFGSKICCFRLSCLNYKLGKIFYLLKYFYHADLAVFFPWPANIEAESHPVKVNQKGSA